MIKVNLHGHLKDSFGTGHEFAVNNLVDIIKALSANFVSFEQELVKNSRRYSIIVDHKLDYGTKEMIPAPMGSNSEVDIVPYIEGSGEGSGPWQVLAGVVLVVVGAWLSVTPASGLSPFLVSTGVGLIVGGVATLLAPDIEAVEEVGSTESSSFKNAKNLIGQGYPVPVGYGRLRIGSNLISAYFTNSYEIISTARVWLNTTTAEWQVIYSGLNDTEGNDSFQLDQLWYGDNLEGLRPASGYDVGYQDSDGVALTYIMPSVEEQVLAYYGFDDEAIQEILYPSYSDEDFV